MISDLPGAHSNLTATQAMHQAGDTAETYLVRALRAVAKANPLPCELSGMPPNNPLKYPELVAAVVQAQALDYFAWAMADRLTSIGTALEKIAEANYDQGAKSADCLAGIGVALEHVADALREEGGP